MVTVHTLTEELTALGNKLHLEFIECIAPIDDDICYPRFGFEIRVYVNDHPKEFMQLWAFTPENLKIQFEKYIDGLKY